MKSECQIESVPLAKITKWFVHSRTETVDENLADLAESIRLYGVLEPVIVRTCTDGFEGVAGERRFKASKLAGLKAIPCIVKSLSDEEAFFLGATENLQRQGLSDMEKTLIVTECAKRYRLDALQIAERLGKSESWVRLYYPDECKNPEKVRAGLSGGRPEKGGLIIKPAACEFCGVGTSDATDWQGYTLCQKHAGEAVLDPAKFRRFFGFQHDETAQTAPEPKKPSLESWEDRKAHMSPEHSEMEETIMQLLLGKDVKPILTNQKYCLLSTVPDFVFPSQNLAVYLDGKAVHNGRQDRDDELRDLLRKRHGMRVLSITYGSKSKGEVDRVLNEILREVKKD